MPKDCMYLIHEGELRALLAGDGGRVVELNTLTAGELLAFQFIQRLVQRVRTLTRTVGRLASVDVYGRLVGLFDALAVDGKGQRVVPGPLSPTAHRRARGCLEGDGQPVAGRSGQGWLH